MVLLSNIISQLPPSRCIGNTSREILRIVSASAGDFNESTLTWISSKNQSLITTIKSGVIICSESTSLDGLHQGCTYILVKNPRSYFSNVVQAFFVEKELPEISLNARIHPSVRLGTSVTIKEGVVIEKNCVVGNNSIIDCNTIIKKYTIIGNSVTIGCNCTIGGVGFGYEKDEAGDYQVIPHIGNVVIEDGVDIGNNTAIDRAVLGSTFLRKNCKVDNLVHIAHGVEIGENALIIANAMIGGSSQIGKNVWFAPSASVLNKISIGEGAVIGMGAVVLKNVPPGQVIVGNPGKELTSRKS